MDRTVTTPIEERLVGGYTGRLLGVIALCSTVTMTGQMAVPSLMPTIVESLEITPAQSGFALTVLTAASASCQFLGGRLADCLSRKTVLAGALALFVLGFTVLAGSSNYAGLLVGVAIVGAGAGVYFPTAFAQLSDLFVARRGQAFGVTNAAYSLGSALGPLLAVGVLAVAEWRATFVVLVGPLGLALLLVHRWNHEPYVLSGVSLDVRATAGRLFGSARIRRVLATLALGGFVWFGTVNFLPTLLQFEKGFDPTFAGAAFAGLFVLGAVVTPLAGHYGDRFGYATIATASTAMGTVGVAIIAFATSTAGVVVGIACFALGFSSFWPVMNAYAMESLSTGSNGGDFGAMNTATLVVGSLGPLYVGVVAEHLAYATAYVGLAVCSVGAVAMTLLLQRG